MGYRLLIINYLMRVRDKKPFKIPSWKKWVRMCVCGEGGLWYRKIKPAVSVEQKLLMWPHLLQNSDRKQDVQVWWATVYENRFFQKVNSHTHTLKWSVAASCGTKVLIKKYKRCHMTESNPISICAVRVCIFEQMWRVNNNNKTGDKALFVQLFTNSSSSTVSSLTGFSCSSCSSSSCKRWHATAAWAT